MKVYDRKFYEQLDYIMQQYRDGNIKTIHELVKFIEMVYGDYREFHPDELPEIRYAESTSELNPVSKKSGSQL